MQIRKPNLQLIYVSDIKCSVLFYTQLFNLEPAFSSPRYVAFQIDGEAFFALWTGGTVPDITTPRFSEIGIMLASDQEVAAMFDELSSNSDIKIVRKPYTDSFGLTFLITDPDGHIIRICRVDE